MDQRLRELEQRLRGGDVTAAPALLIAKNRSGELSRAALELLAALDYQPAKDLYKNLLGRERSKHAKWNKTLWLEAGQIITVKLMGAALNYPFLEIFNKYPQWEKKLRRDCKWSEKETGEFKSTIEKLLVAIQNLSPSKPTFDPKLLKSLNNFIEKFEDKCNFIPDENAEYDEERYAFTTKLVPNSGRPWVLIFKNAQAERIVISIHSFSLLLKEVILCLSPTKKRTFYRILDWVLPACILFHVELSADFKLFEDDEQDLYSDRYRQRGRIIDDPNRKKIEEWQIKQAKSGKEFILDWIQPRALELLLTTPTKAKSSVFARGPEFYKESLEAKRFSVISVHEDDEMQPKGKEKYCDPDNSFSFVVWSTNKEESSGKAEKVLYKIFGYIPDYSIYSRNYLSRAEQLVAKNIHDEAILEGEKVEVPDDVIRAYGYNQSFILAHSQEEVHARREEELQKLEELKKSRPDLY